MSTELRKYIAKGMETDQKATIEACGLLLVAIFKAQECENDMEDSTLTLSIKLQGRDYEIQVTELK